MMDEARLKEIELQVERLPGKVEVPGDMPEYWCRWIQHSPAIVNDLLAEVRRLKALLEGRENG